MMKKYSFILALFLSSYTHAQCTFEHFFNYYPGEKSTMMPLNDGGYLIYGTVWADTIEWSEMNLILIKTDSCGNTIWVNNEGYQGAGDPAIYAIEMDSGNIMVVGYTAAGYTARIGKYNKNGQLVKEQFLKENTDGFVNGIVKNAQSNTYLIYGRTNYIASSTGKPLITEINENLDIIRRKEFQYSEFSTRMGLTMGGIGHLMPVNINQYYCIAGVSKKNYGEGYLVELDSAFAVKKRVLLPIDSLYSYGFYTMILNKDQQHFDGAGIYTAKEGDLSKQFIFRMDLDGNIQKITYLKERLRNITCMSPTLDGGYITGPELLKVDSNLNIEWMKPTGGRIYSVVQLPDSSYICGGISMERRISLGLEPAYEIYMVRMDKDGNYNYSGIEDARTHLSNDIIVYPNPSPDGLFTIKSNHLIPQNIAIYNTNGQLVYTSGNESMAIDLSSLASGVYRITIQYAEGRTVYHENIVIQR